MPFIFIDHGHPAVIDYHSPKQASVSPLDKSALIKPVQAHEQQKNTPQNPYQTTTKNIKKVHTAQDIMSQPVLSLELMDITPEKAWQFLLSHNIKHLPITKNGLLTAISNESDLLKYFFFQTKNENKQAWLIQEVYAASKETDIHQLAHAMFDHHISALPIIDEQKKLIGLVTRSDILKVVCQYGPLEFWA